MYDPYTSSIYDWFNDDNGYTGYEEMQLRQKGREANIREAGKNELGMATELFNADHGAEFMATEGARKAQQAMLGQAGAAGANPALQRAALMQGGQLQSDAANKAAEYRLQEDQLRRQMMMEAYARQAGYEQSMGQLDLATQQALMGYLASLHGDQTQMDLASQQQLMQIINGMVGAVAGGAGAAAMSDERSKELEGKVADLEAENAHYEQWLQNTYAPTPAPPVSLGTGSRASAPIAGGGGGGFSLGTAVPVNVVPGPDYGPQQPPPPPPMPPPAGVSSWADYGPMPTPEPMWGGDVGEASETSGMVSDERAKKTAPAPSVDRANRQTMRNLEPTVWRYKPGMGHTTRAQEGPTAQNLERTPVGGSVVYNTPRGKVVDTKSATLMNMAMLGTLQRQIDDLYGQRGGRA